MYKFKNQKAFSLIELLFVIAIVGILSAIVLNNLSQSRIKAYDAQVKMQIRGFRAAAESYYTSQNPADYGVTTNACGGAPNTTLFNTTDAQKGSPAYYIAASALPVNTQVACGAIDGANPAYAIKATLHSGTQYWCTDSKGTVGAYPVPMVSATACP